MIDHFLTQIDRIERQTPFSHRVDVVMYNRRELEAFVIARKTGAPTPPIHPHKVSFTLDIREGLSMSPSDELQEIMQVGHEHEYSDGLNPSLRRKWLMSACADDLIYELLQFRIGQLWNFDDECDEATERVLDYLRELEPENAINEAFGIAVEVEEVKETREGDDETPYRSAATPMAEIVAPKPGGDLFMTGGLLPPTLIGASIAPTNTRTEATVLMERYHLLELLGEGGMGQVYKAFDTSMEEECAVKLLHPMLAANDELKARFVQEIKLTRSLLHPDIIRTYTLQRDPHTGLAFFTMELLEGNTLEEVLERREREQQGPFSVNEVLELLEALVGPLEYAHGKGILHRDLKPSNIMCLEGGSIKMMDFGIAKALVGAEVPQHTGMIGTVYYNAPEQYKGNHELSPATDVFSLGVIAYRLLTNEIPMGYAEPPSHLVPGFPIMLDSILQKAMSTRSQVRYQSVRAFVDAFRAAAG